MDREGRPDAELLSELAGRLREARHDALTELGVSDEDLRSIDSDRESELEERAQQEAAFDRLNRLEEHAYRRVRAIQDALDRIADGSYGACVSCREPIDIERLRAIPEALHCHDCAAQQERDRRTRAAEEEG